jgi:hypothetical protein
LNVSVRSSVTADFVPLAIVQALGQRGIDSDSGRRAGPAANVEGSGNLALVILVGDIRRIGAGAAVDGGGGAIADAIEDVAEFHSGDRRVPAGSLFSESHLSHVIVSVIPFAPVRKNGFDRTDSVRRLRRS